MAIDLAVWHEGMPVYEEGHENEGKPKEGRWVIATDVSAMQFLLADPSDGGFYWHSIMGCTVVKMKTPDQPAMVLPVQPAQQPQSGLVTAAPNRQMRRNMDN